MSTAAPGPFAFAALLGVALTAAPAHADEPLGGDDLVTLNDGESLRGTVLSSVPGVSVVIRVSGESAPRTLPWADVAEVQRGAARGPSPRTRAFDVAHGPPVAPSGRGVVRLHVESPVPVVVWSHDSEDATVDTPHAVCTSPCDTLIDTSKNLSQRFTVSGDATTESERFSLGGRKGPVRLDVHPGRRAVRTVGSWLAGLGGVALGFGAALLVGGLLGSGLFERGAGGFPYNASGVAGGVLGGVGLGCLIAGLVLVLESRTTLEVSADL